MGNIFKSKKDKKNAAAATATQTAAETAPAKTVSTKAPKKVKEAAQKVEESASSSESASPVAQAPVQHPAAEKPTKGKKAAASGGSTQTTPKSDEPHDEDAPSPSDAAAGPESRTDTGPVEDFGSSLVKAQKHVRTTA